MAKVFCVKSSQKLYTVLIMTTVTIAVSVYCSILALTSGYSYLYLAFTLRVSIIFYSSVFNMKTVTTNVTYNKTQQRNNIIKT